MTPATPSAATPSAAGPAAAPPCNADGPTPLPPATHWAAMHVCARAEKVVAAWIRHEGGTAWLPLARNRRTYGARIRESWLPLFPGYVFYDSATYDGRRAYRSNRVARVLVPATPDLLGPDLATVAHALHLHPDLCPGRPLAEPGTPVEVTRGPLLGTRGHLLRREHDTVLVLRVDFLGFGAELTIDEAWVQAA